MYKSIQIKRFEKKYHNYWNQYSLKMERSVILFDHLLHDAFLTLEFNSKIIKIVEYPLEIEYMHKGRIKKTLFDFWIQYIDGTEEFIAVRYNKSLNHSSRIKLDISAQQKWCKENNVKYRLLLDSNIRQDNFYLKNISYILNTLRNDITIPVAERNIIISLLKYGEKTIYELNDITSKNMNYTMYVVCSLLYSNQCTTDIYNELLTGNSKITLIEGEY